MSMELSPRLAALLPIAVISHAHPSISKGGAEIAAQAMDQAFDDLDAPVKRLNGAHAPTPYSPSLEAAVVPDTKAIVSTIKDLLAE